MRGSSMGGLFPFGRSEGVVVVNDVRLREGC